MAKASPKSKAPKASSKTAPKAKAPSINIEKVSVETLKKLKTLNIEHQLQADIEWCLGSYHADKNPVGLYDMASRALLAFKSELEKKTRGVTAKLISDLEKTLASK